MDKPTYLACLESDYRRLRAVAADTLTAKVPSCPEWTVTDLVNHVAMVYVDKTKTMRTGKEQPWPPTLADKNPIAALDPAYAELVAELTARDPDSPAVTWYKPDQTAGFWQRRMAQETVIHRVDAELAAGVELAPIPADLAVDGIDEVLVCFLAFAANEYPGYLGDHLASTDGRAVLVDAGAARWAVRMNPTGIEVTPDGETAATISASPDALLLWLWRRSPEDSVDREGDTKLIATLRHLLDPATQ